MHSFETSEKKLSQLSAVQLLISLGYEFISSSAALHERQGHFSNVLLEGILYQQLKEITNKRL